MGPTESPENRVESEQHFITKALIATYTATKCPHIQEEEWEEVDWLRAHRKQIKRKIARSSAILLLPDVFSDDLVFAYKQVSISKPKAPEVGIWGRANKLLRVARSQTPILRTRTLPRIPTRRQKVTMIDQSSQGNWKDL